MKLIYAASPYAGDVEENIKYVKQAYRSVVEQGYAFFAPHLLYPSVLDDGDSDQRQLGIPVRRMEMAEKKGMAATEASRLSMVM